MKIKQGLKDDYKKLRRTTDHVTLYQKDIIRKQLDSGMIFGWAMFMVFIIFILSLITT